MFSILSALNDAKTIQQFNQLADKIEPLIDDISTIARVARKLEAHLDGLSEPDFLDLTNSVEHY